MVDYSNQKPVQNPFYSKKPPVKSQLTTGGDGGQGAALAANVNGASGQANQDTIAGFKNDIPAAFQKGGAVGVLKEGAQNLYKDISGPASRLGGNLAAGTTGLLFGKEAGLQQLAGTNQPTSSIVSTNIPTQSNITVKPNISTATPPPSTTTKAALGQFTTPTGGFANISISPNQPISTEGKGLRNITPEQQTYLQGQIDRNARPEVQAEFARQAQIVNDRIAKSKGEDIAELQRVAAGYSPDKIGSYEAAHLAQARLGQIDKQGAEEASNQIEQAKAIMQQGTSLAKQQSEDNRAKLGSRQESIKQMLSADNGMATPATRNAIFKQYNPGQPHDLESVKLIHANDPSMIEVLSSGDPQAVSDALMSAGHTRADIENILKTSNLL